MLVQEEEIGWVTPPEDPTKLAQLIAAAAADAACVKAKGIRATLIAARYTRSIALGAYRDLMDRLLSGQRIRSEESLANTPRVPTS